MNAIQTFNFHSKEVRTATDLNGDVYFCLTDVADVLEISNANPSRFNLDEAGVHKMYISYPSGSKQVTFIKEYSKDHHSGTQTLITPKGRETLRLLLS